MQQETLVTKYYTQIVGLSERELSQSILDNWAVSPELRGSDSDLKGRVDSRSRSHAIDVQTQMQSFNFFFRIQMGVLVLRHTDNSSFTLRYTHMYMSYYKAQ